MDLQFKDLFVFPHEFLGSLKHSMEVLHQTMPDVVAISEMVWGSLVQASTRAVYCTTLHMCTYAVVVCW